MCIRDRFISGTDEVCPNCSHDKIGNTTTDYYTPAGRFHGRRCLKCGAVGRGMENRFKKASRETLVRSIAR